MKVLVTGGTGFIGQALIPRLLEQHEVYCHTRRRDRVRERLGDEVVPVESFSELGGVHIDAVVNLAGAGIADSRWTDERKTALRSSRIDTTRRLIEWIDRAETPPSVLISGSAIGYYGDQPGGEVLTEKSNVALGFTHKLCADWEEEALRAQQYDVRVCLIRTGVVMGKGGALQKMLPPFKLGLGGPIGSGQQWMSWIHIDDQVEAILHLLNSPESEGPYNLTSPEACTNGTFSKMLAAVLKRPAFFRVPPFVIRMMLGEGAELLLGGQNVYPGRLEEEGFRFRYASLQTAFEQILKH